MPAPSRQWDGEVFAAHVHVKRVDQPRMGFNQFAATNFQLDCYCIYSCLRLSHMANIAF
jgi:hypothetical protein